MNESARWCCPEAQEYRWQCPDGTHDVPTERVQAVPGYESWTSGTSKPFSPAERRAVQHELDIRGMGRIITKDRRETRHGLHLILTLCTFGAWAFTGWPIAWAWNRFGPRRVTTTQYR